MSKGKDKAVRLCVNYVGWVPRKFNLPYGGVGTIPVEASLGIYAIMTLTEATDGTLIISVRSRGPHEEYGKNVNGYRYSIHPSDRSPTKVTTIKLTQSFEGMLKTYVLYTRAVRSSDLYCPVFVQRCAILNHLDDRESPDPNNVILDSIDNTLALFFAVVVAAPDSKPPWIALDYAKMRQLSFCKFSLFVIYTFHTHQPSFDTAIMRFNSIGSAMPYNDFDLNVEVDKYMRTLLSMRIARILPHMKPWETRVSDLVRGTTLIQSGVRSSPEYQNWRFNAFSRWRIDPEQF